MSMSLIAASQNHSISSSARLSSSAKVSMPCWSMNRFSRLFEITSGLGSHITSPITTGCTLRFLFRLLHSNPMGGLPGDFADKLTQVLEPGHREAAAGVIEAATRLDDAGLRRFLEL